MKFWVNIDKPSECYLHRDTCTKVPRDTAPSKKEAESGWYSFNSKEEAEAFLAKRFPDKSLFAHYCIEEHAQLLWQCSHIRLYAVDEGIYEKLMNLEDLLTLEDEFEGSKKGKIEQIKELLSDFCTEFLSA